MGFHLLVIRATMGPLALALQLADASTTWVGLSLGLIETNPLVDEWLISGGVLAWAVAKLGAGLILWVWSYSVRPVWLWPVAALNGVMMAVVYGNWALITS
jgi:hypothetical protein